MANPFATPPRCFVTCPTKIPPNAEVITGTHVARVQFANKTSKSATLVIPAEEIRNGIAASAISIVIAFDDRRCACNEYCVAADATPDVADAVRTAATPTLKFAARAEAAAAAAAAAAAHFFFPSVQIPRETPVSTPVSSIESITPARSKPPSATTCVKLWRTPKNKYTHNAVDTSFVWFRQLNVTESMDPYAVCSRKFWPAYTTAGTTDRSPTFGVQFLKFAFKLPSPIMMTNAITILTHSHAKTRETLFTFSGMKLLMRNGCAAYCSARRTQKNTPTCGFTEENPFTTPPSAASSDGAGPYRATFIATSSKDTDNSVAMNAIASRNVPSSHLRSFRAFLNFGPCALTNIRSAAGASTAVVRRPHSATNKAHCSAVIPSCGVPVIPPFASANESNVSFNSFARGVVANPSGTGITGFKIFTRALISPVLETSCLNSSKLKSPFPSVSNSSNKFLAVWTSIRAIAPMSTSAAPVSTRSKVPFEFVSYRSNISRMRLSSNSSFKPLRSLCTAASDLSLDFFGRSVGDPIGAKSATRAATRPNDTRCSVATSASAFKNVPSSHDSVLFRFFACAHAVA
eukprot:30962-Pelagococcus_subviridis.AAC.7